MSLFQAPCTDLLDRLAARQPTPGGGAAGPAVGAIAAALARMVVSYSVGKKSLAEHQPELESAATRLDRARTLLLELADEDAKAYARVNELSRLEKSDPRRAAEHPEAVEAAVQAPEAVIAACADLLRLFETLVPISNRMLRSDLAMAAIFAEAAARASRWNVLINLPLLTEATGASDSETEARLTQTDRTLIDTRSRLDRIEKLCIE